MFNINDFGKTSMKELELIVKIFNPNLDVKRIYVYSLV